MDLDDLVFNLTITAAIRWHSYAALKHKVYANRDRRQERVGLGQWCNENRYCVEIPVLALNFSP